MTVDWSCTQCGKTYQHPTFVIEHIAKDHYGGEVKFDELSQWILVRVVGEPEE